MTDLAQSPNPFRIITGSRLHFGLYRFAPKPNQVIANSSIEATGQLRDLATDSTEEPWYGGVGLMIQDPATEIDFQPSGQLEIVGDPTGRVHDFVERWFISTRHSNSEGFAGVESVKQLPVRVTVFRSPPQHSGLGAGTQMALVIGQGLTRFFFATDLAPEELAKCVGRGLRSAVGTHGFFRGGLIVDRGKCRPNDLGVLDGAFRVPEPWRVVLIMHRDSSSIHGSRELQAFRDLPEIPVATTQLMLQLTREQIVPAILAEDFESFAKGIYSYGLAAGNCFRQIQGGPFASARAQSWVDRVRAWGFPGVGQSSWGPTLFCLTPDSDSAGWLLEKVSESLDRPSETAMITRAQSESYQIETP
jgi:beta-ribofuranosylaminobenzene 5'-phosphate synthase